MAAPARALLPDQSPSLSSTPWQAPPPVVPVLHPEQHENILWNFLVSFVSGGTTDCCMALPSSRSRYDCSPLLTSSRTTRAPATGPPPYLQPLDLPRLDQPDALPYMSRTPMYSPSKSFPESRPHITADMPPLMAAANSPVLVEETLGRRINSPRSVDRAVSKSVKYSGTARVVKRTPCGGGAGKSLPQSPPEGVCAPSSIAEAVLGGDPGGSETTVVRLTLLFRASARSLLVSVVSHCVCSTLAPPSLST
mmetsp:Transcript_11749/g.26921  ORF Transcript_11749/g.26921 Transcript_11749/m.26921 type:complete len:251 (+) Transcript_11749:145-897(+)